MLDEGLREGDRPEDIRLELFADIWDTDSVRGHLDMNRKDIEFT